MADTVGRVRERAVKVERIGAEHRPVIVLDGFADDPDALRRVAADATFAAAGQHYPGVRAALPPQYLRTQLPIIASALARTMGRFRRIHVIDASFSMVTTPPGALEARQRLPHVDAYAVERIALVHYLSPDDGSGTAFYRHRQTGFETIDGERAPGYFDRLREELSDQPPAAAYIASDTPLFERIGAVEARYNRAVLYRSFQLHSGAIAADATLSADPAAGRLTVTAFLEIE